MLQTEDSTSLLAERGFDRYDLFSEWNIGENDPGYRRLLCSYVDLPPDPYAHEAGRFRRYGRGVLIPWSRTIHWVPDDLTSAKGTHGYDQADNNPDYVNIVRRLPAIPAADLANEIIERMVWFDYDQTAWNEPDLEWPVNIGIHFIVLRTEDADGEAYSSPNELHQDGEPYVFAHLIYRRGALGGRNVIAKPSCRGSQPEQLNLDDILAEFTLDRPMEAYGIKDVAVSHYVAPISCRPGTTAERAIMLVDMIPMRQNLILYSDHGY